MGSVRVLVAALAVAIGTPLLLCSLYLATLSMAAFRKRRSPRSASGLRLAVVIPAHNEETIVGRCIDSLSAQTYPSALMRLIVIADNCTDSTAAVAERHGADVLVRSDSRALGKGHALRWAFDVLLAEGTPPDCLVVVDADSIAEPGLLEGLAARAENAEVVQGDYQVLEDASGRSALRAAAFLLFHRSRFLGRAALGWGCALVGNGMLFRQEVLERVPWNATSAAEDLEYTVSLRLAGIVPRFAPEARLTAPAPTRGRAGDVQRRRWEGGRFHVMRHGLPALLRRAPAPRPWSTLDMAIDLATPPLGLLGLAGMFGAAALGILVVTGVSAAWALIVWLLALAFITVHVVVGLLAAHAPARTWRALAGAPLFLALKVATYARLSRGLRADTWERTPREPGSQQAPTHTEGRVNAPELPAPHRVAISGVPIDVVDTDEAVARMMAALDQPQFLQVCTVNLHFLTTARRNPEVRDVLTASGLNVADGAPVVWLGRRFGGLLPERVAGADLVPDLLRHAAKSQRRVFLLGGQGGVAEAAAESLTRAYPGLVVAGTFEPPHTSADGLPTDEIVQRLHDSKADILLAGLGHPKQELWIHRNRHRLPACVAIGVGCTLELLASRAQRAPGWMQRHGLEWLYRLVQTPRRLASRYAICALTLVTILAPLAMLHSLARTLRLDAGQLATSSVNRADYSSPPSQ